MTDRIVPAPSLSFLRKPGRPQIKAAEVLEAMAKTFRERNAILSDNYRMVAPIMKVLFPEGVPAELVMSDRWHIFELIIVKITRFANTSLQHVDSVHDIGVYAAMIEAIMAEESAAAAAKTAETTAALSAVRRAADAAAGTQEVKP